MKRTLKKGFTLIELMVVIAIIGILATTLAPKLREQLAKAKDAKAISLLGATRTAASSVIIDASISSNPDSVKISWSGTTSGLLLHLDVTTKGLVSQKGEVNIGGSRKGIDDDLVYNGIVRMSYKTTTSGTTTYKEIAEDDITLSELQEASDIHLAGTSAGTITAESGSTLAKSYSTEKKAWLAY